MFFFFVVVLIVDVIALRTRFIVFVFTLIMTLQYDRVSCRITRWIAQGNVVRLTGELIETFRTTRVCTFNYAVAVRKF